ncbi:MAG: TspO/MBR family protein [Hyphomicrobiales bacterium]
MGQKLDPFFRINWRIMSDTFYRARIRKIYCAIISLATAFTAGAIGNIATIPSIPGWYAGLVKPSFNPPNWIFGPVWTLLYLMIAIAFWRILIGDPTRKSRRSAIIFFVAQMAFNAGWSVAFFGMHNPALALGVIAILQILIVLTIMKFLKIDRIAGALLIPYALWVAFAMALNVAIVQLNA